MCGCIMIFSKNTGMSFYDISETEAIRKKKERLSEFIIEDGMTSEETIEKLSHSLRELCRNDEERKEVTVLLERVLKMAEESKNKEEIIKNLNNMILEYLK